VLEQQKCVREKSNFVSRFNSESVVQSTAQKFFASVFRKYVVQFLPSRAHKRALRDRHECRARDAMDATTRATSAVDADGEGAWSWHPSAGAKLVDDLLATVTKKVMDTEQSAKISR
jgi:hypothetical protein